MGLFCYKHLTFLFSILLIAVLSLSTSVRAQDLTCMNCFSLNSIDPGFTDLFAEFNNVNCENGVLAGNVMTETCPDATTYSCETIATVMTVSFPDSGVKATQRNIRFILRGCLEQQALGCLPVSDVLADLQPVFTDAGFDFTIGGSTGSACYCDGDQCNDDSFTVLQGSSVTCAFCTSTAFPDPIFADVNTDQNLVCEQGTIDGVNAFEVSCPISAGYSCDTSVNNIVFFDPDLGNVAAVSSFRGCIVGPENGCLPEATVAESVRTALVLSGLNVVDVIATDCYCSQDNCNTQPINVAPEALSCISCFSLRVLDAAFGNLFADFNNLNCENGVMDGTSVVNETCAAGSSASCETIASTMSANVTRSGIVDISVTFRGCSAIEVLECVPPQLIQTGFQADLQASGIALTILSMTGSVCYCGNNDCNMLPTSQLQATSVSCVYCISDFFLNPALSDLNTDRNLQCEAGVVDNVNVLTAMCPQVAGYNCATAFSTVTFFSQDTGEFDLQSVLRSCIPSPPTGCNPDYVQNLLTAPVDPPLEIRNADGSECYCSTNQCNNQELDVTVTVPPAALSCISCVSLDFGDPSLDAQFRILNCEDSVLDGVNVVTSACAETDNRCVTISANVQSEGLPPFVTVLRSCASATDLGCVDAATFQTALQDVLGVPVNSITGEGCYCEGNNCNNVPVQTGPGDNMAPTIIVQCPSNINLVAPQGSTTAVVTWVEPVAIDDSGSVTTNNNFSPGDPFPVGTTTVQYIFEDNAGNSASCSFVVTIQGSTPVDPFTFVVPCPDDIMVTAPAGQTGVEVSWQEPVVIDSQGNIVNPSGSVPPTQIFPIGTSTITYTYSDSLGNSDSCSFNVIVQGPGDNMAPIIIVQCPSNINLVAPQGSTTAVVTWVEPVAIDDSGSVTTNNNFSPGDPFPVGTTTVEYTFEDNAGNSVSCSFVVTIQGSTPVDPFTFVVPCPDDIMVTAPAGQTGVEVSWQEPVVIDSQGNIVNPSGSVPPTQTFPIGTSTITYTYSDSLGNSDSCSFNVIVQGPGDITAPIIIVQCPSNINLVAPQGSTTAVVTWVEPVAIDDSGSVTTNNNFSPGDPFPVGTTTVEYTFEDNAGNSVSCSFVVTIQGSTPVDPFTFVVPCPDDIMVTAPAGQTGVEVSWQEPVVIDSQGNIVNPSGSVPPTQTFPIGTSTITYTYSDSLGNSDSCSFNVIVQGPPVNPFQFLVPCPTDIEVQAIPGQTEAVVTWQEPIVIDSQGNLVSVSAPLTPGDRFSVGTTTVTYTFSDNLGNSDSCLFDVTVLGSPVNPFQFLVPCPTDIEVQAIPGQTEAVVTWQEPIVIDSQGNLVSVSAPLTPGDRFSVGTTTVTYTFSDNLGNSDSCLFDVTVLGSTDTDPPIIRVPCPSDIVLQAPEGFTSVMVQWVEPEGFDLAGGPVTTTSTASPGQLFQGTTEVTYTFTDTSGNSNSCSFTVTILPGTTQVDTTPPTITTPCPSDRSIEVPAGVTAAPMFWPEPVAMDESGPVTTTSTHQSGSNFPLGTTTVTYTFADAAGNTATCSFNVVITGPGDPQVMLECPNDVVVNVPLGVTRATVSWTPPVAVDGNGQQLPLESTHEPNTGFSPGVTTVTYTVSGTPVSCSFNVIVQTVGGGSFQFLEPCPTDIDVTAPPGLPGSIVSWQEPIVIDSQGNRVVVTGSTNPNQFFPIGVTTVMYTYSDNLGNTGTCSFDVIVRGSDPTDTTPPVITTQCPPDQTLTVASDSEVVFPTWTEPQAFDESGTPSVATTHIPGSRFSVGNTVVTYTFADTAGNTVACSFTISVMVQTTDQIAPVITRDCPADITDFIAPGVASSVISWVEPMAVDNSNVEPTIAATHRPGTAFPPGTTTVIYRFTDASGNVATCTFGVTVIVDSEPPMVINCPDNIDETPPSGASGIVVTFVTPTATDNSGVTPTVTSSQSSGDFFPIGTTVVMYTFTDGSNNIAQCTFFVTVGAPPPVDTMAPVVTNCPDDIQVVAPAGTTGTQVQFVTPTAVDNSGEPPLVVSTQNSGDFFPIGTTTVAFSFIDGSNNVAQCLFLVTVSVDNEPPEIISCPTETITVPALPGTNGAIVSFTTPMAVDNSGEVPQVISTHSSGDMFPIGTTTVIYTFQDMNNNIARCTFTVQVTGDVTPPVITSCPTDIQVTAPQGQVGVVVTFTPPSAIDDSGIAPQVSPSHQSGQLFPIGKTIVTYIFTDGSGNSVDCTFCVIVDSPVDVTPPMVINCPDDTTAVAPRGSTGTQVTFVEPFATDESGQPTVTPTHRSGDFFFIGTTTVVYIFTDANGNSARCTFFVTVTEETITDVEAPEVFNCPDTIPATAPVGSTGVVVEFIPPAAQDNSGEQPQIIASHMPGDFFPVGTTFVTYTFSDRVGNVASCSFTVVVTAETPTDVTPPMIFDCPQLVEETVPQNSPGTNVFFVPPRATDNSNVPPTVSNTMNPGDFFPLGATSVIYTFTDAAGNSNTCSFTVVVSVEDPGDFPTIIVGCPPDITSTLPINRDTSEVFWFPPQAVDRNGNLVPAVGSHQPGDSFPVGVTTVTYTFTDFENNMAFCSFMILVNENPCTVSPCLNDGICLSNANSDLFTCECVAGFTGTFCEIPPRDTTPPDVFFCPTQPIVREIQIGEVSTVVTFQEPMASDVSAVTTTANFRSGASFNVGTTSVTFTFQDEAGNQAFCVFDVVVRANIDTESPTVTFCPEPIAVTLQPGQTSTTVLWQLPSAVDPSGVTSISNFEPGAVFSVGTTEVRYVFTDGSGNQAFCNFVVDVIMPLDTTPPTVSNCPNQPITRTVPAGTPQVVVTWTTPTATDASGIVSSDVNFQSGSSFPVGTTTVQYTFIDGAGNLAFCVFDVIVTVTDTTLPMVSNCPAQPITRTAPAGTSQVTVTWTTPTATDASGIVSTDVNFQSGSSFPVGTTTVRYTFIDGAGNPAFCVFDVIVTVTDTTPPTVSNCPPQPITRTAPAGTSQVTVTWTTPTATDASGIVSTDVNFQSGSSFPVGTTTVRYTFIDGAGNPAFCVFDVIVTVTDTTPPTVSNCPPQPITRTAPAGTSQVTVTWTTPTATDASGIVSTDVNFQSGSSFPVGTTTVQYIFVDGAGNPAFCVFDVIVTVTDTTPPTVSNCPTQPITRTAPAGTSQVTVTWTTPTATDASGIVSTDVNLQSGSSFSVGTTTVRYTFIDGAGNSAFCVFDVIVTVTDTTPPTVSNCPPQPITRTAPAGTSQVTVTWTTPTATDASGIVSTDVNFQSGSSFSVGTTTVQYVFVDGAGNPAFCVFDVIVTVTDTIPPTVSNCPTQPITRTAPGGTSQVTVTWTTPTATDASGIVSTDVNFQSGSSFPVGTTTVQYTFVDGAGNPAFCVFDVIVTVTDTTPPTVSNCPPQPITRTAPAGTSQVTVTWTTPTATDASGIVSTDVNFQSGSSFSLGTTTVRYTFIDGAGNPAFCVFDVIVTVTDTTPPNVINCPPEPIRQTALPGMSGVIVTFTTPTATDVSGIIATNSNFQSGFTFPVGTTPVMYTFVDGAGNTAVCTFDVIVSVIDGTPPTVSNCPTQPITRTAPAGTSQVTVTWTTPTASDASGIVSTDVNFQSGSSFPVGTTTVQYTFVDGAGNIAFCVFDVIVSAIDITPPTVSNCPTQPITRTTTAGTSQVTVTWITPTATDASGIVSTDVNFQSGSSFPVGTTTVQYTFIDGAGNPAFCVFDVIVTATDTTPPTVSNCPTQPIRRTVAAGTSQVAVTWTTPTATDASGIVSTDVNFQSGSSFPVGTTTVQYIFIDGAGNPAFCIFDVIVTATDTTPPTVSNCPTQPITRTTIAGTSQVTVTWTTPTATDASGIVSTDVNFQSGSSFPVGTTTVQYTFIDGAGNPAFCIFDVIVTATDTTPPTVSNCPTQSITRTTIAGTSRVIVTWTTPTATDASAIVSNDVNFQSGSSFPVGTTTVQYVFVDGAGNVAFCVFDVIVTATDTTPPTVSNCPTQPITRTAPAGTSQVTVTWTTPTATDASGIVSTDVNFQSGSSFSVGTTTVQYVFVDGAGNIAFCTFDVIVNGAGDQIPPVIASCPDDIVMNAPASSTFTFVQWMAPTATDDSGETPTVDGPVSSSGFFTEGNTVITYTFTDRAGNSAVCNFNIIIVEGGPPPDTTPPTITNCPNDITRSLPAGTTSTTVTWQAPTATDPSGVQPPTVSTPPGSTFTLGETIVRYTFTDSAGNSAVCSFTVIIQRGADVTPPVVNNCPGDITRNAAPGTSGVVVTWTPPTATDASGVGTPSINNPPGTFFNVGTTQVVYTFTDGAGNQAFCIFNVIVIPGADVTPPVVNNCPGDITRTAAPGTNGVVVTWTPPTATDASGVGTPSINNPPGTFFNVGTTQVVYTFTDGAGNQAFCRFNVIVIPDPGNVDNIPPVISGCPSNIVQPLGAGTFVFVDWENHPTAVDNSGVAPVREGPFAPSGFFTEGVTEIVYTFTDDAGNEATCSFTITISQGEDDTIPPVISSCPSTTIVRTAPQGSGGVVVELPLVTAEDASPVTRIDNIPNGSFFPIGTTPVVITFTDQAGNQAMCEFNVIVNPATVVDVTPPTINNCPDDITRTAPPGSNGLEVSWITPTATDPSGVLPPTVNFSPGSFFEIGTTQVVYTFFDIPGNPAFCFFNVIVQEAAVVDVTPPTINNCPDDITRTAPPGSNGLEVSWITPTATDPSGVLPPTVNFPPGSFFEIGTTQVLYNFFDTPGNPAFCFFNVIVQAAAVVDVTPPTINNCPDDITRTAPPGSNGLEVSWITPTATDPSGVLPPTVNFPPGSFFEIGTTQVLYNFFDTPGNPAFCFFNVIVQAGADVTPPVVSNCPGDITRTAAPGTSGVVVTWTPPTATDASGVGTPSINNPPGTFFNVGTTQVVYTFTDGAGNQAFCRFNVIVIPDPGNVDNIPPVISGCPSNIVQPLGAGTFVFVDWENHPTAVDNSGVAPVRDGPFSSSGFFTMGVTEIVYTFTDDAGNEATCSFTITIIPGTVDNVAPVVNNCPMTSVTRTAPQGSGGVIVDLPLVTAEDDSPVTRTDNIPSGSFFPVGTTPVVITFTDPAGNQATCQFNVVVNPGVDVTPPTISNCPGDITRTAEAGTNGLVVLWMAPTATDPSGVGAPSVTNPPGTFFPIGTTEVVYTFFDGAGNPGFCSFSVIVQAAADVTPPVVTNCPGDITRTAAPGTSGVVVTWTPPTATDASGVGTPSINNPPGTFFNVGTTQVVYTFTDGAGNQAFCIFNVIIQQGADVTPPVVSNCPGDITRTAAPGANGIVVTWTPPTATDASGVGTPSINNPPGTFFNVGTTQVVYTFTDGAGNQAFCIFNVIIQQGADVNPPVVSNCPGDITRTAAPGTNGVVVTWIPPTATDSSGVGTPSINNPPGTFFNVGTTQVVYTFTDGAGNQAFCRFNVIVIPDPEASLEVINCPDDIQQSGASGTMFVSVDWTEPTARTNTGTILMPSDGPLQPQGFFTQGTTEIIYTFTSGSVSVTCSFNIIISVGADVTPPVVSNCPGDITRTAAPGTNGVVVTWTPPTATDASGVGTPSINNPPGTFFNVGTTQVVYTFTDGARNQAFCRFNVIVQQGADVTPPVINNCPGDITRTAAPGTNGVVVTWTPPTATDASGVGTPSINNPPGTFFNVGTTQVVYTFTDGAGNQAFCRFNVIVIPGADVTPPVVSNCPGDITRTTAPGTNGVVVTWTPPTATDPSGLGTPSINNPPGTFFNVGTTQVVYTFTDGAGNQAFCIFNVVVIPGADVTPPVINNCPGDIIQAAAPNTNGIVVSWTPPTATDASGVGTPSVNNPPGTFFNIGTTQVVYTFTDGAGNQAFCRFSVIVQQGIDTVPPTIVNCPSDITVTAPVGSTGTVVTWTVPTATDSSGVGAPLVNFNPGFFSIGTSNIEYRFTDGAGNLATCSFTVTVSAPVTSLSCLVCTSYSYRDSGLAQQNVGLQDLDCENGIVNGGSVTVEECMSNADSCVTIAVDIVGDESNGAPVRSVIRACAQAPSLSCVAPSPAISFFLSIELGITISDIEGQMCYCADQSQCNNLSTIGPVV